MANVQLDCNLSDDNLPPTHALPLCLEQPLLYHPDLLVIGDKSQHGASALYLNMEAVFQPDILYPSSTRKLVIEMLQPQAFLVFELLESVAAGSCHSCVTKIVSLLLRMHGCNCLEML